MEFTLPLLLITVITALAAWRDLRANPEAPHGRWSYIALFSGLLYGFIAFGSALGPIGSGRESSKWGACISNMKQHALALRMYSADNDERLPDTKWWSAAKKYLSYDIGGCPSARKQQIPASAKFDYALNQGVQGANPDSLDEKTMLLAEIRPLKAESVVSKESQLQVRHQYRINFALVDGSVRPLTTALHHVVLWGPGRQVDLSKIPLPADPDRFRAFRKKVDQAHGMLFLFAWPTAFVGAIFGTYRAPRHRRAYWRQMFTWLLCLLVFSVLFSPVFFG